MGDITVEVNAGGRAKNVTKIKYRYSSTNLKIVDGRS